MAGPGDTPRLTSEEGRLLQLAFDRFKRMGEWPQVDELQHALDTSAEDLDVVDIGEGLDPLFGRVDRGPQGRVTLTLRGIRRCAHSGGDLEDALNVMRLAYQHWLRDGPNATLSSGEVEAELGIDSGRSRRALEYIRWLPGISGGSVMADGSWTRQISREIRRTRDAATVDALVDLEPLPFGSRLTAPSPPVSAPGGASEMRSSRRGSRQRGPWGGRWERVRDLGQGGQAHTFIVRDLSDGTDGWVLKRLKNPKRIRRFEREVKALTTLQSGHVPRVVDHSLEAPAYLVTPYIGLDLEHLRREMISVDQQLDRFRQIVVGTLDAHRAGLVHRDIKPSNVVVHPDGRTFLVDFGICAEAEPDVVLTTTAEGFGNRAFSAPECEPGAAGTATPAADLYSLGKLLYWMTTGGGLVVRETFNADRLPSDPAVREVILPILARTIREDPGQRWTSAELLDHVDWARARLAGQRDLAERGLTVVADGFGPDHEVYHGGSRSATTPPHGNPPDRYELAEAFSTGDQPSVLRSLELYLAVRAGGGQAQVTLEADAEGRPSGQALAAWSVRVSRQPAGRGEVTVLEPNQRIELEARRAYWVCLSAVGAGSDIAWVSAAINLVPRRALIAERAAGGVWRPAESPSGPGHALRVLAVPPGTP